MSAEDQFGLLVELDGARNVPLRSQLEHGLRAAVRSGRLHPGTRLPSSRGLAAQLGVSRGVVVEAYSQLVAEGYLTARQGDGTRVAAAESADQAPPPRPEAPSRPRYDFSLGLPDLSAFPRSAWLAAMRRALRELPDARLGHPDPQGVTALRRELAAYLGRVRGVVTDPGRVVVCTGFWQGLRVVLAALAARGARRVAMEDPSFLLHRWLVEHAGMEVVPVPVDGHGMVVDRLAETGAHVVLATPAHQFPTGVVMAPSRRAALVEWAEREHAVIVEDDYDAEYRFDREPVGSLQGLAPERVVYGGTASKTLAPALRLGWLAVPGWLVEAVAREKAMADGGSGTLDQLAYALLLERGELDRHLRRTRRLYRRRRAELVAAVAHELPEAVVTGVAAGLHAVVELPPTTNEGRVVERARARGVHVEPMSPNRFDAEAGPPALLLGYAGLSEPALRRGVAELAAAAREAGDAPAGGDGASGEARVHASPVPG